MLIGVHAPEFAFEKLTSNVQKALQQFTITYPVAQDNDFKTWFAYKNRYWPAEYLIDAKGHIRKEDFGEGGYDEMDAAIRELLSEAGYPVQGGATLVQTSQTNYDQTPESYLGLARLERFSSPQRAVEGLYPIPCRRPCHPTILLTRELGPSAMKRPNHKRGLLWKSSSSRIRFI